MEITYEVHKEAFTKKTDEDLKEALFPHLVNRIFEEKEASGKPY